MSTVGKASNSLSCRSRPGLGALVLWIVLGGCGGDHVPTTGAGANHGTGARSPLSATAEPEPASISPLRRAPTLELRQPIVDQLSPGTVANDYTLATDPGDYLHIVIEQRGVDVVAELWSPAGDRVLGTDRPTGSSGGEHLHAIADSGGMYRVRITAFGSQTAGGEFSVALSSRRPATAADRARVVLALQIETADRWLAESHAEAWEKASTLYRRALTGVEPADDETRLLIQGRLAWLAFRLARYDEAMATYAAAIGQAERLGLAELELWMRNDSGSVYRQAGRIDEALASYERAVILARQLGNPREEVVTTNNQALVQRLRGKPWIALLLYQDALAGWRRLGDRQGEAVTLHNLGVTQLGLRRLPEAEASLRRSLELLADEDLSGRAATLTSLATAMVQNGDPAVAESLLHQALELRREAGDRRGEAVTLDELASLSLVAGDKASAARTFRHVLEVFRRLGDLSSAAHTLIQLAEVATSEGAYQQALRHLDDAFALYHGSGDLEGEAEAEAWRARVHLRQGDPQTGLRHLQEALATTETVRLAARSPTLRSAYVAASHSIYELHTELRLALHRLAPEGGHAALAFEAIEKVRARTLRESLLLGRADPEALPARLDDLGQQIRALELDRLAAIRHDVSDPELATIESALRQLLFEREKIRTVAEGMVDTGQRSVASTDTVVTITRLLGGLDVATLQRQVLDDETFLLAYALGDDASHLFALDRGSLTVHPLPGRKVIEPLAQELYRLLSSEPRRGAREPVRLLSNLLGWHLLGPVADRLGQRRLVIMADGALHLLPWAALSRPTAPPAGQGEPLVTRHQIVVVPSASVVAALRARPRPEGFSGTLAVIADPIFDRDDPRLDSVGVGGSGAWQAIEDQPRRAGPARGSGPPDLAGLSSTRDAGLGGFTRLRFARQEADAILSLVARQERFAAFGSRATREVVLGGGLAGYRYLHFATHGVLHDEPELSGLVLSLVDGEGQSLDGFLRAFEIAELGLSNELVVLGSCRSALGDRIAGEGMVGLPRSFLQAGVKTVLVSLWDISDPATAELMAHFYRALLEGGERPAAALRRAQLSMCRSPRWGAPYYWAGFVLQGDWQ